MEERKLAAILFTDIEGYTATMQANERKAKERRNVHREILEKNHAKFNGEIVNYYGDGSLSIFPSTIGAVRCAVAAQKELVKSGVPVKMALHLGDVVRDESGIYGDGVNVASRLESIAQGGSILVSEKVYDDIKNHGFKMESLGTFRFKNVTRSIEVFAVMDKELTIPSKKTVKGGKLILSEKPEESGRKITVIASLSLLIVVVIAGIFFLRKEQKEPPGRKQIAVLPFDVQGFEQYHYLGNGMVDILSSKLDGIGEYYSVDPNIIISYFSRKAQRRLDPRDGLELAKNFGASRYILGNIIQLGNQFKLSATLYDLQVTPVNKVEITVTRENEFISAVDDLSKQLIAQFLSTEGQEIQSLASLTTSNFESLKLFLKGEELRRAGKYVSATENYFLAVQLDSTFALSWTRLHQVCGWSHKYPVPPEEIRLNMARYSKSLPPKLREFVSAVIKFYEVEENSISAFQDLLLKYGENADLITWMGEALFHENHWFGQPILEAKPHFIKAMEYDPHNMEIKHHLAQLACLEGDTALLRTLLKSVTPDADHWPGYEALRLVTLEGSWTDEDVNKIFIHPNFSIFSIMTLAYNDMVLDKTILLFEDIKEKGNMEWNGPAVETVQSVLSGQYIGLEDILKKENIPLSVVMIYIACTMGERTFEPFAPYYDLIIGNSEGYILEPQLHDMADVIFKTALEGESGSRTAYENFIQKNADNPVWIHFMRNHRSSLLASFNGENELAKIHIDSSIYYARRLPGASLSNIFMVSGLKFLKAEILFREGRYSEALGWYNSVVRIFAEGSGILLPFVTYRRAQCLEKIGHNLEAVRQYDRFIQLFRDCDEPFQHLVRDAAKARENLFKD